MMRIHRPLVRIACVMLAPIVLGLATSAWSGDPLPRIAFAAASADAGPGSAGSLDIHLLQPDGSLIQLTRALGPDRLPAWSPDGKQIAFVSARDGSSQIFVMKADGSSQRRLTADSLAECDWPTWSPDGKQIGFEAREQPDGAFSVYVMSRDGRQHRRIAGGGAEARRPAWRPDGKRLAVSVNRQDGWYLCTAPPDGSGAKPLWQEVASKNIVPDPAWSPDAARIVFTSDRDDPKGDIYLINADGSDLQRLTQSPARDGHPTWSPDGSQILFESDRSGKSSLYVMAADGSSPTLLHTGGSVAAADGAWDPKDKTPVMLAQAPAGAPASPAAAPSTTEEVYKALLPGVSAIQQKKFDEAIQQFANAKQLYPKSPQPDWWIGKAYMMQDPPDYEKAIGAFADAINKDDSQPELGANQKGVAYGTIGTVYLATSKDKPDRLDKAIGMLRAAVAADQSDPSIAYELARAFVRKGDTDRALSALKLVGSAQQRAGKKGWLAKAQNDPDFQALRQDPHFIQLVAAAAAPAPTAPGPAPTTAPGAPGTTPPAPAPPPAGEGPARLLAWTSYRDGNPEIYLMDLRKGQPVNLTQNPASDEQPAISPSLTEIAFVSDRDGNKEIYVIGLDGKNLRRLTNSPGADIRPRWTADGKKIIFCSERGGNKDIWIMDADGSYATRLTHDADMDQDPDVR